MSIKSWSKRLALAKSLGIFPEIPHFSCCHSCRSAKRMVCVLSDWFKLCIPLSLPSRHFRKRDEQRLSRKWRMVDKRNKSSEKDKNNQKEFRITFSNVNKLSLKHDGWNFSQDLFEVEGDTVYSFVFITICFVVYLLVFFSFLSWYMLWHS